MGNFHRFVDPTYNLLGSDAFPGTIGGDTYDRVNVTSGGIGGPGGAANADGAKGSGVNVGTYFVAFGEDGTSQNTNRGLRALSENTDAIDHILRTNIPKWTETAFPNPSSNYIQLSGDVFVGDDPTMDPNDLVHVVGINSRQLYNGTTPVDIVDIDQGTPGTSVVGTGWYTDPWLRLSLPANEAIGVAYGTRTSTARIVEVEREAIWKGLISAYGLGKEGLSLDLHGLDERYRRSTDLTTAGVSNNTPGSGAVITRDGPAVEVLSPDQDYSSTPYPDEFLAHFKATQEGNYLAHTVSRGRQMAFLGLSTPLQNMSGFDEGDAFFRYGDFVSLAVRHTNQPSEDFTRIPRDHGATLNPSGNPGTNYVQLNVNAHFRKDFGGQDKTAVRLGIDLLQITRASGAKELYVIDYFVGATYDTVGLTPLNKTPAFPSDEAVQVRWIQPVMRYGTRNAGYYALPYNTELDGESLSSTTEFISGSFFRQSGYPVANQDNIALRWGAFHEYTGNIWRQGTLYGNGDVWARIVRCALRTPLRRINATPGSTEVQNTYKYIPQADNLDALSDVTDPGVHFYVTEVADVVCQIAIWYDTSKYQPQIGDHFTMIVEVVNPCVMSINWNDGDGLFLFSGGEGTEGDGFIEAGLTGTFKWEGVAFQEGGTGIVKFLMTRTDYLS